MESQQKELVIAGATTITLATIAVILRLVSRRLNRLWLIWDDYLCLAAFASAVGFTVCYFLFIKEGVGLHYQDTKYEYDELFKVMRQYTLACEILYAFTLAFAKLSMLALYLRIFDARLIWPVRILSALVLCWLTARVVTSLVQCYPLERYWDPNWDRAVEGYCRVDMRDFFLTTTSIGLALDLAVLALPGPLIRRLNMPRSQRFFLFFVFLFGGFICLVSVPLIIILEKYDKSDPDVSWSLAAIAKWAVCEVNLSLVSICLASLRPVVHVVTSVTRRLSQLNPADPAIELANRT